ncbi:MAG: hypothetical protein U5R49_13360 [Deltaproteobacteria bacterium]|nr:hypothetical protein [Deltaproteobacteria bacterium]
MKNLQRMISANQEVLDKPGAVGREADLRARINDLRGKLKETRSDFERLSTGVDSFTPKEEGQKEVNWNRELSELLGPLMSEAKKMTSRPREMEKLRNTMRGYEDQLEMVEKAKSNLLALISKTDNPQLTEALNRVLRTWDRRQNEVEAKMAITRHELEKIEGEKKSLSESLQNLARFFFKSRGKNLLLSLLAFALVWVGLRYVHRLIFKFSPFHKKGRTFPVRAFDLIFLVFTAVFSFLALVGTLYSLGDWVLLSLAVIFAMGVAWTSKQAVPRFWDQATLMLNFGAVREGEVVLYKGVPYEVKSINVYSQLENRALEGGFVRLHIKDLTELRSRPSFRDEPWFPSRQGNWILLDDGTYGEVIAQTPDSVRIRLKGGATRSFRTPDYLSLSPTNLSKGFRISASFGLDYQHQAIITQDVPQVIEHDLHEGLKREGLGEHLQRIRVEFMNAGPSSLDLAVLAEFDGAEGPRYQILERAIQRMCVETCNAHQWVIPFQQITVHMPEREEDRLKRHGRV